MTRFQKFPKSRHGRFWSRLRYQESSRPLATICTAWHRSRGNARSSPASTARCALRHPNPRSARRRVKEESETTRSNQFSKTCYPEQIQAGPSPRMRYIYETKGPPTITMRSPNGGVTLSSRCRTLRTIPTKRANLPVLVWALEKRVA
jgi:hypothetical protein